MVLICEGSELQAEGPATQNALSASFVSEINVYLQVHLTIFISLVRNNGFECVSTCS